LITKSTPTGDGSTTLDEPAQQAVEADGRASWLASTSCLSPVVKYHGLARRQLRARGFLMRPQRNGGTLARPEQEQFLRVDVLDPISPSRAVFFRGAAQSLVAIVDGSGSWGSGREAADHARNVLSSRWGSTAEWSVASISNDISEVALSTPNELRDQEFGWSFSVTCLLCAHDLIELVAAGFYRVDVLKPSGMANLFRPAMLVDQLLADGTLRPETVATFSHQHICLGPFVGDRDRVELTTARHVVEPGEFVVVTHANRFDLSTIALPVSAESLAASSQPDAYPGPVVVIERAGQQAVEAAGRASS
jgi:hypothetical protein